MPNQDLGMEVFPIMGQPYPPHGGPPPWELLGTTEAAWHEWNKQPHVRVATDVESDVRVDYPITTNVDMDDEATQKYFIHLQKRQAGAGGPIAYVMPEMQPGETAEQYDVRLKSTNIIATPTKERRSESWLARYFKPTPTPPDMVGPVSQATPPTTDMGPLVGYVPGRGWLEGEVVPVAPTTNGTDLTGRVASLEKRTSTLERVVAAIRAFIVRVMRMFGLKQPMPEVTI